MATNWQIGDRIQNRWEIYKILRGGMGIVYIVYDQELREPFAAKTFQDEIFAGNPRIANRFTQEALTWVNLDAHQNVTEARFVGTIEGKPFLFLEYVSGGDLGGWIGTPRLTEDLPQALRFAIQFCDGMTYALSKGIEAHRDIKPQNCLITEDRSLKVTDFGLAKVIGVEEGRGGTGGTRGYMAPEQQGHFGEADVRADIYSFGVMLFEMVTGQLPLVERIWKEFVRHSPLGRIVQTCLAKDPTQRFADFSEVREQLADMYERLTGETAPQPVVGGELNAMQWNNKGGSLVNLGRHEESLICFDSALKLNSHYEQAWSNKGAALNYLKRNNDALVCFDSALKVNPQFGQAWYNKANALSDLGHTEEAIACLDRALEINPFLAEAWYTKADILDAMRQHENAIACYDRALKLNPRFAEACYNKGVTLWSLGQAKDAIACYDRALEINPRYVSAWHNKGVALMASGQT